MPLDNWFFTSQTSLLLQSIMEYSYKFDLQSNFQNLQYSSFWKIECKTVGYET